MTFLPRVSHFAQVKWQLSKTLNYPSLRLVTTTRLDLSVLFKGLDKVNTILKLNEVAVEVFLRQKSENYVPAVCFVFTSTVAV